MADLFDETNTEGYTAEQLAWANETWNERYGDIDPDSSYGKDLRAAVLMEAERIDA